MLGEVGGAAPVGASRGEGGENEREGALPGRAQESGDEGGDYRDHSGEEQTVIDHRGDDRGAGQHGVKV